MDLHLQDHVALITGAGSGIGLATARMFAQEGCSVALWDRDEQVKKVAEEITAQTGVRAQSFQVDVASEGQVLSALQSTLAQFRRVEHVVHCAATGSHRFGFPFTNLSPSDWRHVLDVNVMGMVHIAHAFAPGMIEARKGTFLFLASVAGQIGSQTDPPYSASKAANINFAMCLAKDLAPHGIRVNTLCPGMVPTTLNRAVWESWFAQTPPEKQLSYEAWAEQKIRAVVPLGTWQTADDIAAMAVFLSSKQAGQVTGQTINVDGGFVMHW